MTLAELLHAMEFPLIFGEANFIEVPKIHEICEIYGPRRKSALRYSLMQYLT